MKRWLRIGFLVLAVLLAGCLGFGESPEQTTTADRSFGDFTVTDSPPSDRSTTTDGQSTTTPTDTPSSNQSNGTVITAPPGVSVNSVDEALLANLHAENLRANGSFTATYRIIETAGDETRVDSEIVAGINLSTDRYLWIERSATAENRTFYTEGDTTYLRYPDNQSRPSQTVSTPPQYDEFLNGQRLISVLQTGEFRPADGVPGNITDTLLLRSFTPTDVFTRDIEEYGAEAVVTTAGTIQRAEYSIAWTDDGTQYTRTVSVTYSFIGTTKISRPTWVTERAS